MYIWRWNLFPESTRAWVLAMRHVDLGRLPLLSSARTTFHLFVILVIGESVLCLVARRFHTHTRYVMHSFIIHCSYNAYYLLCECALLIELSVLVSVPLTISVRHCNCDNVGALGAAVNACRGVLLVLQCVTCYWCKHHIGQVDIFEFLKCYKNRWDFFCMQ